MIHPALMKLLQAQTQTPGFFKNSQPLDPELMQRRNRTLPVNTPQPFPGQPRNQHVVDFKDNMDEMAYQQAIANPPQPAPQKPQGYIDKLVNDPNRMGLLRYGMGVLGGEQPGAAFDRAVSTRQGVNAPPAPKLQKIPVGNNQFAMAQWVGPNYQDPTVPGFPKGWRRVGDTGPFPQRAGSLGTSQMRNYEYAKTNPGFAEFLKKTGQARTPMAVQEWNLFKDMDPVTQTKYLAMKRAGKHFDLGGSVLMPDPLNPAGPPAAKFPKTLPPEKRPDYLEEAAESKEKGKFTGEQASKLPETLTKTVRMIELIDKALAHPGRTGVTGMPNILTLGGIVPGTKEADYRALAEQLKGGVFAEAFDALKGGGHITEVEGEKASAAEARLNEAQSDEAYAESLMELQHYLRLGIERAKRKAGVPYTAPKPESEEPTLEEIEAEIERRKRSRKK